MSGTNSLIEGQIVSDKLRNEVIYNKTTVKLKALDRVRALLGKTINVYTEIEINQPTVEVVKSVSRVWVDTFFKATQYQSESQQAQ